MRGPVGVIVSASVVGLGIMAIAWLASQSWIQDGASELDGLGGGGLASAALFALAFVILATLMVPSSMMKLLAGAILGFGWGTMAAWIGSMIGAIPGFLIGRHLMAERWGRYTENNERLRALELAVTDNGIRTMVIVRLSLLLPYNVLNYTLGATRLSKKDYLIGNIATIGPSLIYVWWGSQLSALADAGSAVEKDMMWWTVMLFSLVLTIWFIIQTGRLTKGHLEIWANPEAE